LRTWELLLSQKRNKVFAIALSFQFFVEIDFLFKGMGNSRQRRGPCKKGREIALNPQIFKLCLRQAHLEAMRQFWICFFSQNQPPAVFVATKLSVCGCNQTS